MKGRNHPVSEWLRYAGISHTDAPDQFELAGQGTASRKEGDAEALNTSAFSK